MTQPQFSVTFAASQSPSIATIPLGTVVLKTATGYAPSTAAARLLAGARSSAIVTAQGNIPGQLLLASDGLIPADIANVGTVAAGEQLVFVNATGQLERLAIYDATKDIAGVAYADGTAKVDFANLAFNADVYANIGGGGGGGGGSTGITQDWTPTTQPTIKRFEALGSFVATTIGPVPVPGNWGTVPAFVEDGIYLCKVKVAAQRLSDIADNATFLVERGFRVAFGGLAQPTTQGQYSTTTSFGGGGWTVQLDWDNAANRPQILVQGVGGRAIRWVTEYSVLLQKDLTGATAPQIYTVEPATGAAAGGDQIAITGEYLSTVTGVTFGGIASPTLFGGIETVQLVGSPPGIGTVDVAITTANGTATKINGFTYSNVFNPAALNLSAFFEPDLYNTVTYEWLGKASAGTSLGLIAAKWGGWTGAPTHFPTPGGNTAPKINVTNPAQVQGWALGAAPITGVNNGTIVFRFGIDSIADWHNAADTALWYDQPNGPRVSTPAATAGGFDLLVKISAGPAINFLNVAYGYHTLALKYDFGSSDVRARLDGGAWSSVVYAGPNIVNNNFWGFNPAGGQATAMRWVAMYASQLTFSDATITSLENRTLTL